MAVRSEARLGVTTSLGTTYTLLGQVTSGSKFNLHLNITNRAATTAKLRVYIANTTWASGEPTGTALVAAIGYDLPVDPGTVMQITGIVLDPNEKLIVRSDTAASFDIIGSGVSIRN